MRNARIFMVLAVCAAILLTACGGGAAAPEEPAPVEGQQAAVQYAPFCESAPAGCDKPTVNMLDNKYCVEKKPFAIMSVPAGSTYESLNPDMICVDQMHSDGNLRVTCSSASSKELWSYDLKVCNSACSAPALQMGTGQCQEGYGYDAANQCCAQPPASNSDGCTIYRVDIGGCPEPN